MIKRCRETQSTGVSGVALSVSNLHFVSNLRISETSSVIRSRPLRILNLAILFCRSACMGRMCIALRAGM